MKTKQIKTIRIQPEEKKVVCCHILILLTKKVW
jgi:hypothetical protein